jgi:hypothetical protein
LAYKKNNKPAEAKTEDQKILEQARNRLKDCIENESSERAKMLDDLRFSALDQWPTEIRKARENDPNGARPCLTVDQLNQYLVQVVNNARQNRPAIKTRPVDDNADPDTAKIYQELVRHIEDQSSAQIAYSGAVEWAARVGLGYFRVTTDYVAPDSFDQEILIKRIPNIFACYLGPHTMPDGSDAEYGFVFEEMAVERFEREHPKAKSKSAAFQDLPEEIGAFWRTDETIVVAEYFYFDEQRSNLLFLENGMTMYEEDWAALPEDEKMPVADLRTTVTKRVKWCKHTGLEILEKRDWAGKYIPIIEVIGKESFIDGKRCLWGLVRPAKDALRAFNYWLSAITEKVGLSPKAPFIAAAGQIEGRENEWAKANVENRAVLQYNVIDVNGNPVAPPKRQEPSQIEHGMMAMLPILQRGVQTSLGMFKASVGDTESQQSGRAILALQRESDTGTFHFDDNLSNSIKHAGRIVVDLIPKIYDTKRVIRIIGEDGEPRSAQIDPSQEMAAREIRDGAGKVKRIYNLGVGKYDVTVTVGPSYNTKRAEQAEAMVETLKSQPQLIGVIGDLMFKSFDWPMSDKIAERLKKLLPPQLQEQPEGEDPIPPQAMAKMAQMGQAVQLLQEKGQELAQENEKLKAGERSAMAKVAVQAKEAEDEIALKEKIAREEARLARQKAEAEFALKKWVAESEMGLDSQKAEFEREQRAKDDEQELATQQKVESGTAVPQLAQMMAGIVQAFQQSLSQQGEFQAQMVEAMTQPHKVELGDMRRDRDGRLIGASAVRTVQNKKGIKPNGG